MRLSSRLGPYPATFRMTHSSGPCRNAFFHSQGFAENPIGVLVEPDDLRTAWESGVPWEDIRRRPPLPAGVMPVDMQKERKIPKFA